MALNLGDIIDGKYRIVRLLGEGGMGAVYEGENTRIHRRVAIKVLHGNVARSADAVQRFEREAQAAGRIGSAHIVEVLDLGDLPDGDRYMVMEYLDGQSLSGRIQSLNRMSPGEIFPIAVQLLGGLAAAHAAGIVHRDLKPDNVYLLANRPGQPDFVKILDFGISKFNALGGEFSMTRTGSVMGTPYYMSPEQAKGARELDQRADLYAVGVILYECLSGRVPFSAETFNELLFKIVLEEPPPLTSVTTDADPAFIGIVSKAMARDVTQRYQTAGELEEALHAWAQENGTAAVAATAATKNAIAVGRTLGPGTSTTSGTAGAWSNTATGGPAPETSARSRMPLFIAAAGLAVVVIGGGVAFKMHSSSEAEAATVAAAQAEKDKEHERLEAEKAAKEAERVAAQAKLDEERQRTENELKAAEQAKKDAAAKAPETPSSEPEKAKTAAVAAKPSASRPKPAAAAPAAKPAAPTNAGSTSAGRPIRTSL